MGLNPDPLGAHRADKYAQRVAEERGIASGSGSGIQA
jgi:L-rhamnose isomerase